MIRIAVCEDNLDELQTQKKMVQSIMLELSKNTEIFGFQNGEDLLFEMDVSGDMNIIFLDVELSGINGIETAQMIRKRDVRAALIFVSGHNQYYREMIEVQPYAFLDKPVSAEKCAQTLRRLIETRLNLFDGYTFSYQKKQYNIPLMHIRLFQSDKRVIRVDTIQKSPHTQEYLFYGKLEEVERQIREASVKFIRIRKSFLVNSHYIMEYSADRVVLDNGVIVEITKKYRKDVTQQYMLLLKGWE